VRDGINSIRDGMNAAARGMKMNSRWRNATPRGIC